MGWFWDSKSSKTPNGDAYSNLDAGLRDFLDKESASKQQDSQTRPAPQERPTSPDGAGMTYRSQLGLDVPGLNQENQNSVQKDGRPAVPAESLFQDGRYAHIWKNYRSQAEVEAEGRSDQDKLSDVLVQFRDRKAAIGRAALENCIEYQMAEKECYKRGTVQQRMTMCRAEHRAFNRCFEMQTRFLKALGYLSSQYTSAEDEEKIQMHADKLYHEMLEREAAISEAKKAGQQEPVFKPLIHHESTTKALGEDSAWARARRKAEVAGSPTDLSEMPPERQEEIRERIKKLTGQEREVELQLIAAETRALWEYQERVESGLEDERRHREERRERGRETAGDTIKRWWGFGSK